MRDIDDIHLPKSSSNEEQETVSRKKFESLFDEKRFILKGEVIDNGIDYRCEIIHNSQKLGFGFNFQLKSKGTADGNADGSYSKSIETSNIEYLINNGQPAFYGFYLADEDKFYYEYLNYFLGLLNKKNPDWEEQLSHTLRFSKLMDSKAVDEIYSIALNHGKMMRGLNSRLATLPSLVHSSDKVVIGLNQHVMDDSEIRKIVEVIGFELINEGRWKDIIHIHKQASGNIATTAKYNFALGLANYYNGNLFDALSFFKSAKLKSEELPEYLTNYLVYFDSAIKYALTLISQEDFEKIVRSLQGEDELGLYVRLEKARYDYVSSGDGDDVKYEQFKKELQSIISHPNSSGSIRQMAKCELLLHEGYEFNFNYIQEVLAINHREEQTGPDVTVRLAAANLLINSRNLWSKQMQELQQESISDKNFFTYYCTIFNHIRIEYQFDVYSRYINVEKEIPNHPLPPSSDKKAKYDSMFSLLEKAVIYFAHVGHTENIIIVLSIRYELEHYLNRKEDASITMVELERLTATTDSGALKEKIGSLKNGGTTHERFKDFISGILGKADAEREEYNRMIEDMKRMDDEERRNSQSSKNVYTIQLFPIGYFQFPIDGTEEAFKILNIGNNATRSTILNMFSQNVVPTVNIYHNPIMVEGYVDGNNVEQGLVNLRRIYEVRKAFFKMKFYRIDFTRNG
ncbi:DUF4365 domain-containing protein [Pontibacter sp. FD36]|uniref:DUF4365 domain-containing protein n=1 Tax=Pontibacter sp. FD36 TaxID=2789860 RepID=UPI0018A96A5E|nr:DUF4365 domain-containing protein [Pontibacter sp. FD36]MBF8963007.1 DUF4365 domain-containing protein [Pontibacter sp. FD36]